jgi:hypothetical protein
MLRIPLVEPEHASAEVRALALGLPLCKEVDNARQGRRPRP